jgi:hypothetical protein
MRARHDAAMADIRSLHPLPPLRGTVDVYSHDQAALFAHGLEWSPRPVFQSYSAYTRGLAELNRRHLEGADAPGHLLVRVQPIDSRFPALEDGASWLPMLERYALRGDEGFVILERQPAPARATLGALPAWRGKGWRELPEAGVLQLAAITVEDGPRSLDEAFKRPTAYDIQVRTAGDGLVREYRFLRSAGEAPFVISPLVETSGEFADLFVACPTRASSRRVEAVRIMGPNKREVPYRMELQVAESLPRFAVSAQATLRGMSCDLRLLQGPEGVRRGPYFHEAAGRGLFAHPPSSWRVARPASRVVACTRLAARGLQPGASDGYAMRIGRAGARPAAQVRVSREAAAGGEACIEARFPRPADDIELHVDPGGDDNWDWVYITRLELDG